MDLKTALKDILPRLRLKAKHKPSDRWAIDRPIEFHVCNTCEQTVDQRIVDISIFTSSDEFVRELVKKYGEWCMIHNAPDVIDLTSKAKPCSKCYRWFLPKLKRVAKIKKEVDEETGIETTKKMMVMVEENVCWTCRHNPWCEMPVPMMAERSWYVAPKAKAEVLDE